MWSGGSKSSMLQFGLIKLGSLFSSCSEARSTHFPGNKLLRPFGLIYMTPGFTSWRTQVQSLPDVHLLAGFFLLFQESVSASAYRSGPSPLVHRTDSQWR